LFSEVGQLIADVPERFVIRHRPEMRRPFSVVCLSRAGRIMEEF
jgi:hypothetical protein